MAALEIRKAQALELKAAKEKGSSFLTPPPPSSAPPPLPPSQQPSYVKSTHGVTSLLSSAGQRR